MNILYDCLKIIIFFNNINFLSAGYHQRRLLEDLFANYDRLERPVIDDKKILNVTVGLALQQIVDVDEKKQIIVFSGWLDMTWIDYNLRWNPEEYGNISSIRIPSTHIWIPDLLVYNSADESFDATSKVNAVLYNTGEVTYLPPGMFKCTCPIKIDDFPFDEQKCSLKLGSWTHDETVVNLKNKSDKAQLDSYIKNGEWYLEGVRSYAESIKYECCPIKYPFVMFIIHIRRRTLYFIFNLIFPCILISFMSVLGFLLPPDSGEKIGLEITTLLSIIMFSQIITGIIPESSLSVPKISLYFASVMVTSAMSIIANVCVLIFHHRNAKIQKKLPKIVEILICKYLATLLRMKMPVRRKKRSSESPLISNANSICELNSKSLLANVLDINDDLFSTGVHLSSKKTSIFNKSISHKSKSKLDQYAPNYHSAIINYSNHKQIPIKRENSNLSTNGNENFNSDSTSSSYSKQDINVLRKNLNAILKEIRLITQKLKDDDDNEEKSLNWKFAAMVIDRLCMVIFSSVTICSTLLILFSKNFLKPSDPDSFY